MEDNKEKVNQKNFNILINNKHFVTSLIEILTMASNKSDELKVDQLNLSEKHNLVIYKDHVRLKKSCDGLIKNLNDDNSFQLGAIIKKVYKTLTQHLNLFFPDSSIDLFYLQNKDGAVITIIPSIDLGLVVKHFTQDELDKFWSYMYMLYISAVGMILEANEHKKEGKVWSIIPAMRERVTKAGLMMNGKIFNPFVGMQGESGNYSMETMFENVDEYKQTGPSIEDMMKLSGFDKLVDVSQLKEQLGNVQQEDIGETTKTITKMLGAEEDQDINEVCSTLIEGIFSEFKANPNANIGNLFEMTGKMRDKIDNKKMEKTATQLIQFVKNGEDTLKNMTDDNGNPIGEELFNSLKMLTGSQQGSMLNFAQCQNMMTHVTKTMSQFKNNAEKGKPK